MVRWFGATARRERSSAGTGRDGASSACTGDPSTDSARAVATATHPSLPQRPQPLNSIKV